MNLTISIKAAQRGNSMSLKKYEASIFLVLFFFAVTDICLGIECSAVLPADAKALDDLKICEYPHLGKNDTYACQDITSKQGRYRILFKGGHTPKLIIALGHNKDGDMIIWSKHHNNNDLLCTFPTPLQVPALSKFMGAGVCENEKNETIPCSIFRYKAPRQLEIPVYMVFYDVKGKGVKQTTIVNTSVNQDAVPAELAYQIGIELLASNCCQQQGVAYLEYAYHLFPDSKTYRDIYKHINKNLLAERKAQVADL